MNGRGFRIPKSVNLGRGALAKLFKNTVAKVGNMAVQGQGLVSVVTLQIQNMGLGFWVGCFAVQENINATLDFENLQRFIRSQDANVDKMSTILAKERVHGRSVFTIIGGTYKEQMTVVRQKRKGGFHKVHMDSFCSLSFGPL